MRNARIGLALALFAVMALTIVLGGCASFQQDKPWGVHFCQGDALCLRLTIPTS